MLYTIACKKCKSTFWGKATYCGECDPKRKNNPFRLIKK